MDSKTIVEFSGLGKPKLPQAADTLPARTTNQKTILPCYYSLKLHFWYHKHTKTRKDITPSPNHV